MTISQNTLDTLQDAPQPNMQPDEFNLKAFAFAAILYTLGLEINETVATLNQASTTSESGDTLTIGLGAKNLTVEAGKSFAVGMTVRIADTVTGTRWMNGDVTAYDPLTGNLSVNVSAIQGSGNANVWTVSQSFGGLTAGSVDTDKLASLAVTTAKIAGDSISTDKIQDNSITVEKLSSDAVPRATAVEVKSFSGSNLVTPSTLKSAFEFQPQVVTGSRAVNTVYTNSTNSLKFISITAVIPYSTPGLIYVDADVVFRSGFSTIGETTITAFAVVPPGATYRTSGMSSIILWAEASLI